MKAITVEELKCEIIVDDGINQWTYFSNSRDVKKLAMGYGHARAGETITVYKIVRKDIPEHLDIIGRAVWDVESRKYIRVLVEK